MGGAFAGFLLAIPNSRMPSGLSKAHPRSDFPTPPPFSVLTQLESISDWLTKILIGVAIANLRQMGKELGQLTAFLQSSLGGKSDEPWIDTMIVYFLATGFMLGYIGTRSYLRPLVLEEGAKAIGSLSKALDAALKAPAMVNYEGFVCLQVLHDGETLRASDDPIPVSGSWESLALKVWLQGPEPQEWGILSAPVIVSGGEARVAAEFEIRLDSDNFRPDRNSQAVEAPIGGRSEMVAFRINLWKLQEPRQSALDEYLEESAAQNPVWVMLFQQNRLVQTVAVDFTLRA
jgi:hypothetical protein